MANQFSSSVDFGLRLSRRIYYGQGPAPAPAMSRSPEEYLPTAPMCYAVISDPDTVDNPDIRSYQPYVHGKCDPPALIPLQLLGVTMEVDCSLDTAFVTVNARWRVHCVLGSSTCDCRLAIPMGEQPSSLFETLISHLMSSSNEQRFHAEALFNLYKQTDLDTLSLKFAHLLFSSSHQETRAMPVNLLRKQLTILKN